MGVKAVILAGGSSIGTRFRPLSIDTPKVLFPIAGKPLLTHIIDNLVSQLGGDLEEVFLISFFKDSTPFDEYVDEIKRIYPDLKVSILIEPYPLGTGGGLNYFRKQILGSSGDHKILLIHGDVICNYPFKELIQFYEKNKADVAILGIDPLLLVDGYQNLSDTPASFKYYDKERIFTNFGTIISNKETSKIIHYVEKPKTSSFAQFQDTTYSININGGVYVFNDTVFNLLEKAQEVKSAKSNLLDYDLTNDASKSNILSFELDVFKILPSEKNIKFLNFKSNSLWYQLKTPIFALLANSFFLKQNHLKSSLANIRSPIQVSDDVIIPNDSLMGPNVSIGKNVKLGKGIRLKNCIIADDVIIDDHTIISNAIVSKGVKIGKWCRIEGTVNTPTVNKDISLFNSDNYLKLINNIVVLCQDTIVGHQVFVYNSIVLPHKELKNDVKYEIVM